MKVDMMRRAAGSQVVRMNRAMFLKLLIGLSAAGLLGKVGGNAARFEHSHAAGKLNPQVDGHVLAASTGKTDEV